jgi:hypothetical protein
MHEKDGLFSVVPVTFKDGLFSVVPVTFFFI